LYYDHIINVLQCKEEKPSTSSQGKAPVKQEMEHWKGDKKITVEIFIYCQQV
jgi:hypothetical protein